jgi:gliding motility-associated-like protein
MKICHTLCLAFLLSFAGFEPLRGQAANDECTTALPLNDVSNWCSDNGAFSNGNASLSNLFQASCFPDVTNDVWFSFVAEATTVQVTVIGNTTGNPGPGGTLENPQFAIYSGSCNGALTEIACASDGFGTHIVESFAGPLTVGQTYYIRVDGRDGQTGTFRLCINNYNAVPDPSSDCPTGVILCDKSSFTVESLIGTGSLNNEVGPGVCVQTEYASAWYRWTCKDAGTLSFTITPSNPSDDIDFAVFELPDGIDDCEGKVKVRCMAAGENVGQPFPNWAICTGPTGLSEDETDLDEFPGCAPGQNNFVAALNMVPGKSYALLVNNFSNTGSGFQIEFGGSGTFQGPEANFTAQPQPICEENSITFKDASTSIEGITDWAWNFGIGASPATANGQGPHQVKYGTPGIRSVTLTITSESGCIITKIQQINVLPQPEISFEVVADYCGPDDLTGVISLQPTGTALPYTYDWQGNGTFIADSLLSNLQFGAYSVIVQDANGCQKKFDIEVPEGLSLSAGVDPVNPPTCNGDADGSISISIQIANNPVLFDFGSGLQASNTLSNIPAGTYNVYAVDAAGCEGQFTIEVTDFPPLVVALDIADISCNGANDGSITAIPTGGAGGYAYGWSNGETDETIDNLAAGLYSITVTDANGCTEVNAGDIIEPGPLDFSFSVVDVICAGEATGLISVTATGGTPPYEYSADGIQFQSDLNLSGLLAGEYQVQVRDASGCSLAKTAFITEPLPLVAEAGPDQTVDLGYTADLQGFFSPPSLPVALSWSPSATLSCGDCQDPVAFPSETTTYYLTVEDEVGCRAIDSVIVTVLLKRPIYIPNVFTPNADGLNDFFTVYGGPAARSIRSLKIFTRWGSLVFEGYDLPLNKESSGWDGYFKGKIMDPAVFAYLAEVEFIDGVVVLHEGDVTILR